MAAVSTVREAEGLSARVTAFAAIIRSGETEETFGQVAGDDALPKAVRRRLSLFDLGVARCICGLAQPGVDEEIVFASRHGNMHIMSDLLVQLAQSELLSPAKFSMSVHNAAVGAASQMTANRAGHTSVAAGARTMAAGLTESWLRLKAGAPSVIVLYSDLALPGVYAGFDEQGPSVQLGMRLQAAAGEGRDVGDGRLAVEQLARELAAGGSEVVSWRP